LLPPVLCALTVLPVAPLPGEDNPKESDPKDIVRHTLQVDTRNRDLERNYTYTLRN
jgi:hypothetical protein